MPRLPRPSRSTSQCRYGPLFAALACFLVWTFATWLLEGRVHALLRPEAEFARLLYTGVANIAIGQIGALALLGALTCRTRHKDTRARSHPLDHRSLTVTTAVAVGLGYYVTAGGPFGDGILLTNVFAQVFVVSAAEVIVCWGLLGITTESWLRVHWGPWLSAAGAAVAASVAFGLYHLAHSPPFNTPGMVAFLTIVGLGTSVFFFVTRDLLATIVFHNFPAVAGVTAALTEGGQLHALAHLQPTLISTAGISLITVLVCERLALGQYR